MENLRDIINLFDFKGNFVSCRLFGSGHINTTYLVTYNDNGIEYKYVFQKVNSNVFKNAEHLMENIFSVTSYLRKKIAEYGGNENRETLHYIKTKNGEKFYKAKDGGFYRACIFVESSVSFNSAENAEIFGESGTAFGRFQKLLADFPANTLYETIPDFHNTEKRFYT